MAGTCVCGVCTDGPNRPDGSSCGGGKTCWSGVCTEPELPEIDVYWADMNGQRIAQAEFGDTVQLIYGGTLSQDMIIREDDFATGDDDIRTISGEVKGGLIVGIWKITEEDLDKTNDYDDFYFEIDGKKSESLDISLLGDDDSMNISIISPACGSYYDNGGSNIEIDVSAGDRDDLIDGEVKIDGTSVENFSNSGVTFDYIFSSSGNSQVVVEATNGRGKRFRAISNIMILEKSGGVYVDGDYIAACILKPEDFSNIEGSVIEFDASTTRGVRVVGGVLDVLVPDEGDVFSWYWNFQPEDSNRNFVNSTDPIAYKFINNFPIAGDNSALLRVDI